MRTAFWSLAALATSAVAAPGRRWGNEDNDVPSYQSEQAAPYYYQKPSPYHHSAPSSVETSSSRPSYSYSFSGNATFAGPTATAPGSYPSTTVTEITTVYTTYCPGTKTHTIGGSTSLSTYMTYSTITDVYTSTITAYPSQGEGSPHGPGSYPSTTVKDVTTVYTTVCPATSTTVQDYTTITLTYETTSTVTEVYQSTCTLEQPTGPGGYSPSKPTPVSPAEETSVEVVTVTETVTAEKPNGPAGYSTEGSGVTHTVTVTAEKPSGSAGYSPSEGSGNTIVTEYTTVYTTVCPATTTYSQGGSWTTKTYDTTSTITSVYTSTVVVSTPVSTPHSGESTIWSTVTWGTTVFSYTVPAKKTTTSSSTESTGGAIPVGPGSSKSSTGAWYPTTTGSGYESGSAHPTGTGISPSGSAPSGSHSVYPPGSGSHSVYPTGSGSHSVYPTGSGSHSIYPSGSSKPTQSPTISWPGINTTATFPGSSGWIPTHTPSMSFPAGNTTTCPPGSSGTAPSASASYTSTTSSACTKPTPSLLDDFCIPCEGQPGLDQFCGYTVDDNSYEVMPKTCRTVEYNFEITNQTVAPDGIPRIGLVINGQMPGPKIEASWGDTIIVHVKNSMQNNGTSIHFHGMRQNYTNEMDGVPSITQCAIAPGDSMTYTFKATNYGTSWYHSHFALQTYEGVFGPMVIHGPTDEVYDDEQMIVVQDWSHATADSMYEAAQSVGPAPEHGPRTLDTGLINGMNVWGVDGAANATGSRFKMTVVQGKSYRLRLVNTAIQSTFKFYIDGHKFKVFAMDFVPIIPYETNIVNINIGQRYDLLFTADQDIGNYWMRSDNQNLCATITKADNIKGIVSYVGAGYGIPTSTAYNYTAGCVDEPLASLVPRVPLNAGAQSDETIEKTVVVGPNGGTPNLFKWTLSGTTFQSQWGDPTLTNIVNNGSIPDYSGDLAIQVPKLKEWVYVIIDSPIPLPHPIHLHGHDFLILAQGQGLYNSNVTLNTVNPPRRDGALMPWDPVGGTGGHLVLAFETDNPGVWLMHCHIGWHTSMGFALQIIEAKDEIKKTVKNSCQLDGTCSKWHEYAKKFDIVVGDSGV